MEEKETKMKDFIEYLSEGLLRNKHSDVPTPVEISASLKRGSSSSVRFFVSRARIARRNYRPRNSIRRSWIIDSASPELGGCPVPRSISIFLVKLLIA